MSSGGQGFATKHDPLRFPPDVRAVPGRKAKPLASALLEEAGWTKDGDWWTDPDGNEAAYDLTFPAEFADYSATGTNVAEQLTAFGFNISPRAITHTQVGPDVLEGRFQMAIQAWGSSAHPQLRDACNAAIATTRASTWTAGLAARDPKCAMLSIADRRCPAGLRERIRSRPS